MCWTRRRPGAMPVLTTAALIFLCVGILSQVLAACTAYVAADVDWRTTNRVRADLVLHCPQMDMPFHAAHVPGETIESIAQGCFVAVRFSQHFLTASASRRWSLMYVNVCSQRRMLARRMRSWPLGEYMGCSLVT